MTRIQYVDGGGPIEVEYLGGSGASVVGSVATAAGVSFGTESSSRKILMPVHSSRTGSTLTLLSATMGGQPASIIASAVGDQAGIQRGVFLIGGEPSGASGNVVLTFAETDMSCSVLGFRTINMRTLTPHATGELAWDASSTDTRITSADTPEGGLFLAASTTYHDGGTTTLSGVPVAYHFGDPSGPLHFFGGAEVITAAEPGKSATVTKSGGADIMAGGLIAASFR